MKKSFKNFVSQNEDMKKLAKAVYKQIGAENDEEFFSTMNNVSNCSCGAAGGFSGFIYYNETSDFWRRNKSVIKENMSEMAFSLGESSVISMCKTFSGLQDDFSEDEIGRALYGAYDEELYQIYNVFAFYALEEVANRANDFAYECED